MTDDDLKQLIEASTIIRDILDNEGHDDDCILRCFRNDCDADHHCEVCGEDEDD